MQQNGCPSLSVGISGYEAQSARVPQAVRPGVEWSPDDVGGEALVEHERSPTVIATITAGRMTW
jgi:hypothetical protein